MEKDYNQLLGKKMLQFITDGKTTEEIINQVKAVLKGGCRWIQIRMKEFGDQDIRAAVSAIAPMCAAEGAVCIMNDRVDIAKEYGLDGVHLGFDDMSIEEARNILGENALIGVTANTIEQIIVLSQQPMSYFGIGPMRFTTTKKNLSPEIGLMGYHNIVAGMHETGVTKPAVAVGGITEADVYDLLDAGLWGVAVSGAIAHAADVEAATRRFMQIINEFKSN